MMNKKALLTALAVLFHLFSHAQNTKVKSDVKYLASDELQGRETGTPAEKMAAEYIAERFREIGLEPKGEDDYFQDFYFREKLGTGDPHDSPKLVDKEGEEKLKARNVLGFIDNKAEQTVVIGAHYDHLGWGTEGSLHRKDSAIHNGADDNASGVAAIIEIARVLKESDYGNNNYLFIAFSGEEKGLLGSNYFMKNPRVGLENINYMINLDMVGRLNDEKKLALNGIGTSPAWEEVVDTIEAAGVEVVTSESGIGPSDHTSFYLKKIPVLHFFTGTHEDYHKPSDDFEKVNFEGITLIIQSIENLVAFLDQKGELAFLKTKDEKSKKAPKFSVTLGVVPDYLFDGEGMRIDGVSEGKTADKAGLKEGDIVIRMGDVQVKDMMTYMKALGKFEKGDKTEVEVLRDEEKIIKKVQFQ